MEGRKNGRTDGYLLDSGCRVSVDPVVNGVDVGRLFPRRACQLGHFPDTVCVCVEKQDYVSVSERGQDLMQEILVGYTEVGTLEDRKTNDMFSRLLKV